MIDKAPDAYRTISEVADDLDLPQHVLRFWETRFGQIKPLKRGGGRRYYRPDDVELLKGIRHLLYNEGYTIKGVQRILKDQGPRAVQSVAAAAEDRGGSEPAAHAPGLPAGHVEEYEPEDVAPAAFVLPVDAAPVPPADYDLFAAGAQPAPVMPAVPPAPVAPPAPVQQPAPPPPPQATVSFTRGGLRAPVQLTANAFAAPRPAPAPASPVAAMPEPEEIAPAPALLKRPRIIIQPPEPVEDVDLAAAPLAAVSDPAHAGLSEAGRRALQSALFELLECRRTIERIRSSAA